MTAGETWNLGEDKPVLAMNASAADHLKHIQLIDENERRIVSAARRAREEYYRLLPYYLAGAKSVAEAVAALQQGQQPQ